MADMMQTLKSILGDDAEDKIKNALSTLNNATSNDSKEEEDDTFKESNNELTKSVSSPNSPSLPINTDGIEYMMKLKNIADELSNPNDTRSQLLMSLRPFMRDTRQKGIDNAIKILNITKFTGIFR